MEPTDDGGFDAKVVRYKRANAPIEDWPSLLTMDEAFFYNINEYEKKNYEIKKKHYDDMKKNIGEGKGTQEKTIEEWKREFDELT